MFKLPQIFNKDNTPQSAEFITLDVGTDYVKCLVLEYDPTSLETKLKIIGVGKHPLGYLHTRGGAIVDFEGVKVASEQALHDALEMSGSNTKDVIIGLSGETTKGLVTTVRLTRSEPETPISEKELSQIISKIQETAYSEASKEMADMTGNPDLDIDIVNSSVVSFKIDDQLVSDPKGLACRRMEVGLFTAFSPTGYLEIVQRLAKALKLNILTISSGMYALSRMLSKNEESQNVVLIDIGGETTDIGIIFGGGLIASKTLSIGGRHFTRAISEAYGLPIHEAEDIKIKYSSNTYSESDALKIKECLKETKDYFISGLELALSDFEGVKIFPSKIALTGGGVSLKDISDAISEFQWTKKVAFKSPPIFEKIGISHLLAIKDMTSKATTFDDVIPASLGEVYLEMTLLKESGN